MIPRCKNDFPLHGKSAAAWLLQMLGRLGPVRETLTHSLLRLVQLRLRIPDRTVENPRNLPMLIALNLVQLKNGPIAVGKGLQSARKRNPI